MGECPPEFLSRKAKNFAPPLPAAKTISMLAVFGREIVSAHYLTVLIHDFDLVFRTSIAFLPVRNHVCDEPSIRRHIPVRQFC